MKSAALAWSAAFALLLVLGVGSSAARNCHDILDNNRYRCRFNQDGVGRSVGCIQFVSPGAGAAPFDLVSNDGGGTYGCTCKATGTVSKPDFNASRTFLCVLVNDPASALEGTVSVNGKKIRGGRGGSSNGDAAVFHCKLAPGCE